MLKEYGEESVLDAGVIVAAQKVEHYEMAWLAESLDCHYRWVSGSVAIKDVNVQDSVETR
jgi:hypothetical protein